MRAVSRFCGLLLAKASLIAAVAAAGAEAQDSGTFTQGIRPIMERSCWNCHNADTQRSDLDLSTRESALRGGRSGQAAIVPGRAEDSRMFRLVAGLEGPSMPREGNPLSTDEVEVLRAWINDGAHWDSGPAEAAGLEFAPEDESDKRDYWAFQLPVKERVPEAGDSDHPIDRFLEQKRVDNGLTSAPRADRLTLLRRAYLDLTGLPPTTDQTAAFLADDRPDAWEHLIDQLLESPHYGERWGRHWLDVARYADSDGFEQDVDRPNAWRYRDYVIDAFNNDKPFDQFIVEQIAGDEMDDWNHETLIATGFLRAGPRVNFREKDNPERRHDYLDDVISTLGRGVLGLTVQCARCHSHKFDPIPQADYYSMQASLFGYIETEYPLLPPIEADRYRREVAEIDEAVGGLQDQIREIERPYRETLTLERLERDFPADVVEAAKTPESERTPGQQLLAAQVLSLGVPQQQVMESLRSEDLERRRGLADRIDRIEDTRPPRPPMAEIVTDGDYRYKPDGAGDNVLGCPECRIKPEEPGKFIHDGTGEAYEVPPSYFLLRGDPFRPGEESLPGFVSVATYGEPPTAIPRPNGRTSGRRLALAEWMTSDQNPLPARVWVNRMWHHHFGRGIVGTLDNFGDVGDRPTHQELLDWLAVDFMENGWSVKDMHRLMMTSEAYQMASGYENKVNAENDLENQFLWRFRPQRLEAEIVRDVIMTASGGIDLTVGGPPIFPHVPEEILASRFYGRWDNQDDGPDAWRRSVYVYRLRSLVFPFFETFDLPDQNVTSAARNVSTVPTQALTLMNNPFVLNQAGLLAERVERMAPNSLDDQINLSYLLTLSRTPSTQEAAVARGLVENGSLSDLAHVLFNLNEFLYLR